MRTNCLFCLPYNKFIWRIILLFYSLCVLITLKRGGSKWTLSRSQHSFSTPVVKGLTNHARMYDCKTILFASRTLKDLDFSNILLGPPSAIGLSESPNWCVELMWNWWVPLRWSVGILVSREFLQDLPLSNKWSV